MNSPMKFEIFRQIKTRREELGLTQTQVAEFVGITRNYMSAIERGIAPRLSWVVLMKVCHALGMTFGMTAKIEPDKFIGPQESHE